MPLNSQQIRALRAETHRLKLKPVVMIGQQGLTESVMHELENTLAHHELIKIKVPALEKEEKADFIQSICAPLNAELIQHIGHVMVLFRQNPEKKKFHKILKAQAD